MNEVFDQFYTEVELVDSLVRCLTGRSNTASLSNHQWVRNNPRVPFFNNIITLLFKIIMINLNQRYEFYFGHIFEILKNHKKSIGAEYPKFCYLSNLILRIKKLLLFPTKAIFVTECSKKRIYGMFKQRYTSSHKHCICI